MGLTGHIRPAVDYDHRTILSRLISMSKYSLVTLLSPEMRGRESTFPARVECKHSKYFGIEFYLLYTLRQMNTGLPIFVRLSRFRRKDNSFSK